jgi:hypothetical protein
MPRPSPRAVPMKGRPVYVRSLLQTITAPMFAISTATRSISSGGATRNALLKFAEGGIIP